MGSKSYIDAKLEVFNFFFLKDCEDTPRTVKDRPLKKDRKRQTVTGELYSCCLMIFVLFVLAPPDTCAAYTIYTYTHIQRASSPFLVWSS
jgi:hypothetical protein